MRGPGPGVGWAILAFALVAGGPQAEAADWPQFGRDGTRNAVSPEKAPPTWWQFEERDDKGLLVREAKNVRWAADLNAGSYGGVYGDPVVAGGLVWAGCTHWTDLGEDRGAKCSAALVCLDERTGEELYRRVSERLDDPQEAGRWHSHASSPYVEGDTLWVVTNRCEVVCLDIGPLKKRTGPPRERWVLDMRKDLGVRPKAALLPHRRSSVAAYKDWVYAITGNGAFWEDGKRVVPAPEAPSLVCLDKATGRVVWQDKSPGRGIMSGQFASPTVIEAGGRAQVVAPLGDGWVRAFDPATGKLLWEFDTNPPGAVFRPQWGTDSRNYLPASAVFHGGRLYIGNGQEQEISSGVGWLSCIDPTRSGDVSPEFTRGKDKGKANPNSGLVWRFGGPAEDARHPDGTTERGRGRFDRTLANVAVADGLVLAAGVGGTVYCLNAHSGKLYWEHDTRARILGAPLVVDGRAYVATEEGTWVFALGVTKKAAGPVAKDGYSQCSPAFANGVLYLAADTHLYAIAGKEGPSGE